MISPERKRRDRDMDRGRDRDKDKGLEVLDINRMIGRVGWIMTECAWASLRPIRKCRMSMSSSVGPFSIAIVVCAGYCGVVWCSEIRRLPRVLS